MLLKVAGSIIVVASCGFIGFIMSRDLSNRPQQLRELQGLLQMLENRITYLSDVILDAFEKIGTVGRSATCVFFSRTVEIMRNGGLCSVSEAWEKALREMIGRTSLNKEDEEILYSFGKSLGNTDMEGQIRNIRLALVQLKAQEEKAEEVRRRNEKMYRSLGVLGGVAVVILLI